MRKLRILKPLQQRLEECETHLYFLWDARRLYRQERDRYKQVAAELRVLVGDHRPKRRLLLSLMDEVGFRFDVPPPSLPPYGPIPLVGWKDDAEMKAISEEIAEAIDDESRLQAALAKQKSLARPIAFHSYVEKAFAVYIAPHDYSYRDLVLAVAQQVGSSHEDEAVDEPLVRLRHFVIGDSEGHIAPLIGKGVDP